MIRSPLTRRENLGLLRINTHIQSIARAKDLEHVSRGIYNELVEFGIALQVMTIRRVVDENRSLIENYEVQPDRQFRRRYERDERAIPEWRDNRILYHNDVENNQAGSPPDYFEKTYAAYGIRVASMLTVPYRQGVIALRSDVKDAFSDAAIQYIQKIAGVLSIGMARIVDLEKIDLSHRFEATLLEINQLVQEMSRVEDLEKVIRGISASLKKLGLDFAGMTIHHILDEKTALIESHHLRPDAGYRRLRHCIPNTVEEWLNDRVLYWPDVEFQSEGLGPDYYETTYRAYNLKIHSLVTVPYGMGIISVRSTQVYAFPSDYQDLFRKIGNVLSVGISRLHDFEELEEKRTEQDALAAISRSVLEMRRPQDVEAVLRTFVSQLKECGIHFNILTYHLRETNRRNQSNHIIYFLMSHSSIRSSRRRGFGIVGKWKERALFLLRNLTSRDSRSNPSFTRRTRAVF